MLWPEMHPGLAGGIRLGENPPNSIHLLFIGFGTMKFSPSILGVFPLFLVQHPYLSKVVDWWVVSTHRSLGHTHTHTHPKTKPLPMLGFLSRDFRIHSWRTGGLPGVCDIGVCCNFLGICGFESIVDVFSCFSLDDKRCFPLGKFDG